MSQTFNTVPRIGLENVVNGNKEPRRMSDQYENSPLGALDSAKQSDIPRHTLVPAGPALESIHYFVDGKRFTGYYVHPLASAIVPGVVVAHEAMGVNEHVKARAQALAEAGYSAFVLDLYGESFPFTELADRHMGLMSEPGLIFKRAKAALEVLASQDGVDPSKLGAIGFCQGGITALELARGGLVRCAVGFHPGLEFPKGSPDGPMLARILMLIGDHDPMIPLDHRIQFAEEMRRRGAAWEFHVFGGVGHAYTNPGVDRIGRPGFAYSAYADKRSWRMMLDLLNEELKG
jgi:dienelactone hydrolase